MLNTKLLCASYALALLRLCILLAIIGTDTLVRRVITQAFMLILLAYTKQGDILLGFHGR
jgi:hypothetical protein